MEESPAERFYRLVPMRDLASVILMGHLLIEEELQAVIDGFVKNPKVLEKAASRFSFYHRMTLVHALLDEENSKTWAALRKLNSIRNEMAHTLEPEGLDRKIDELIACYSRPSFKRSYNSEDRALRLRRALGHLYGCIWRMKSAPKQEREA